MKNLFNEYAQYERNCTLSFALASMMYDPWTHIVVKQRDPDHGLLLIGGGSPLDLIRCFGSWTVERSLITHDGILQITIKEPVG